MNHTYYVATRYSNRAGVERVVRLLKPLGYEITYDWTKTFGAPTTPDYLCSIAVKEIEGVREAGFVVVLLRGGYGTHTELGAALALGRPVILVTPHDNLLLDAHKNIVPFYHHPLVHKVPDISYIPNLIRSWDTLVGASNDY